MVDGGGLENHGAMTGTANVFGPFLVAVPAAVPETVPARTPKNFALAP